MSSLLELLDDVTGAEFQPRLHGVEQRTLAHPALAGYDAHLVLQDIAQRVDIFARNCAGEKSAIPQAGVAFE